MRVPKKRDAAKARDGKDDPGRGKELGKGERKGEGMQKAEGGQAGRLAVRDCVCDKRNTSTPLQKKEVVIGGM